jgi:hypothetical protein
MRFRSAMAAAWPTGGRHLPALRRQREAKGSAVRLVGVAQSRPPWASTIERLIVSPMPMPLGLVV